LASRTNAHATMHSELTETRPARSQHTVGAQETMYTERDEVRDAVERMDPNVPTDLLGYDDPPISLDGYTDRSGLGREIPRPSRIIEHVSKKSASGLPIAVATNSSSNELDPQATPTESSKDAIEAPSPRMLDVNEGELVEIPNTPTQRSSPLEIPGPMLELHRSKIEETDDISLIVGLKSPAKIARITELCSMCQKQRVLTRRGSIDVVW
jgi:hypothetical protein